MSLPVALFALRAAHTASQVKKNLDGDKTPAAVPLGEQETRSPVTSPRRRRRASLDQLGPAPLSLLEVGRPKLLGE